MQQCPNCDKIYDASEYSRCPYCSGELEEEHGERYYKVCPNCEGTMEWEDGTWMCSNCGYEIESGEDDSDGIIEF